MGCDIHMFVEYKNRDEKWISGDFFQKNPYYKESEEVEEEDFAEPEFSVIELHGDRNYALFSTLAGVRDYSDKIIPVSNPKYLPEDITDFVKKQAERWEGDAHTHSWLTLKELRDYSQKGNKLHFSGLISPKQIMELEEKGIIPDSWCQGTNELGFERREWSVENTHLSPLIEKLQKRALFLLQYEWQEYNLENDEKIRIVFWFDN